ncbi:MULTISPECIES: hypothetical protein [unclassified Caballeronia]|uniref:hypothetical protein n=1 Tax=unclassified Caballeronia TaxID=2646786 RepID=UPI0020291871|nr:MULTISPECIES: hypothetical protein [unclassified Caballeronia]
MHKIDRDALGECYIAGGEAKTSSNSSSNTNVSISITSGNFNDKARISVAVS